MKDELLEVVTGRGGVQELILASEVDHSLLRYHLSALPGMLRRDARWRLLGRVGLKQERSHRGIRPSAQRRSLTSCIPFEGRSAATEHPEQDHMGTGRAESRAVERLRIVEPSQGQMHETQHLGATRWSPMLSQPKRKRKSRTWGASDFGGGLEKKTRRSRRRKKEGGSPRG